MVILDNDNKHGSDSSIEIKLLNQYTQKFLSVITIEEKFLFSIQKSKLL